MIVKFEVSVEVAHGNGVPFTGGPQMNSSAAAAASVAINYAINTCLPYRTRGGMVVLRKSVTGGTVEKS